MTVLEVRCQRKVACGPQQAWSYIAEGYFAHHGSWDPAVLDMVQLSDGPLGAGTTGEETRKFGAKQRARFEVTDFEPAERFALRNTSGPFDLVRIYSLKGDPDGTRLTFEFTMTPRGPMALVFPLVRHSIERQVNSNITRLADLLEQRADHP